ncbi:MAG: efflux transporter outer membrane subunit [Verrucomicrobiota bacterium JB023]|nr:efflux transporter outer membrane subunit [Verrucomicrobiota bacterium JB023]
MQIISPETCRKILAATALSIASCQSIGERPVATTTFDLPATFAAASSRQNQQIATGWLSSFRDPALSSVVREALANNPNLQATAANLKSVREGTITARAARLPSLSASGRSSLSRADGENADSYSLSLNASWEPDVWGRLRDLEAASFADFQAAVADFRSARLSLAANTAKAYLNLITAQQQLTLAEQTLESYEENYRIIERGYQAGTLRAIDVNFGRNNVASAQRSLASRRLSRNEAARSLQLLLGTYPDARILSRSTLPDPDLDIPAGLPSSLLERRPDLASRRADLFASAKRADASRKNLLPDFSLSASSGTSSSELSQLLDPSELASSLAASVGQTLFSGGRLSAQARSAVYSNQAQLKLYTRDVLEALNEVESALDTAQSLAQQEEFLEKETNQAILAERQAERDFVEGIAASDGSGILEVLEAQRRALSARSTLISLRNQRLQNHLDLLLALGGSY